MKLQASYAPQRSEDTLHGVCVCVCECVCLSESEEIVETRYLVQEDEGRRVSKALLRLTICTG